MTDHATFNMSHPHQPGIPPAYDAEGRCVVCVLFCERDEARADAKRMYDALRNIDMMNPNDFMVGQDHLTPAFREPDFRRAFRQICKIVNGVLHHTDENGEPLVGLTDS